MSRLDDGDAVLDGRMHADGAEVCRPPGHSSNPLEVIKSVALEAEALATVMALRDGALDLPEFFLQGFLVGLAAAHAEGLGWAEWLLTSAPIPVIYLGIVRASARRAAAGIDW